ncbi:MAG: hypothetical protein ABEL51_12765 [Salinibacter sp.]
MLCLGVLLGSLGGCTTVRQVANLRKVQFSIDRVSRPRLAGIDISAFESYKDLRSTDVLRLGSALSEGKLPLAFTLHLDAKNPQSNGVRARLIEMDWTLLLENKETVSGRFEQEVVLPPGTSKDIGVDIKLDLVRFFDENLRGLVNLASAIVHNQSPQSVKLRVQPTVRTAFGRFKYPSPITVMSSERGGDDRQP